MRRRLLLILLFCLLAAGLWIFLAAGAQTPIDTATPSTPPSASLAVSAPGLIALGPAPTTTSPSVDVEGEEEEEISTEGIDVSVKLAGYQRTKRTLVPGRPWEKLAMVPDDA